MPKALRTPAFGAWLRKQRGQKTLEEFALQARRHASPFGLEFDRSQVVKLEEGRVPSLPILLALAPTLGAPVAALEAMIAAELRGEKVQTYRADPTHRKKSEAVTSPVLVDRVQVSLPDHYQGGAEHDESSATTSDRSSEPQSADGVYLQALAKLQQFELLDHLQETSDRLSAITRALRTGTPAPSTGADRSEQAQSRQGVSRRRHRRRA